MEDVAGVTCANLRAFQETGEDAAVVVAWMWSRSTLR